MRRGLASFARHVGHYADLARKRLEADGLVKNVRAGEIVEGAVVRVGEFPVSVFALRGVVKARI